MNFESIIDHYTDVRRQIHAHPELSHQEFQTTETIVSELNAIGVDQVIQYPDKIGALGIINGTGSGQKSVIAIRADIDALPICEETGKPYASKTRGVMHACGHDGHVAVVLAAAAWLNENKDKFPHTVKLVFQPAEEGSDGATMMIEKGVLENPKVDVMLGFHSAPEVEAGKVGLKEGALMSSIDRFYVTVKGKGGHGAYPHLCVDPILPASQFVLSLQNMISRKINRMENAVASICEFHSGTAVNIVPETAELCGTVRTQNEALRKVMEDGMKTLAEGIASSYDCECKVDYEYDLHVVDNDPVLIRLLMESMARANGPESVEILKNARMGSDDFAEYVGHVRRAAMFRLGVTEPGAETIELHKNRFDFNDRALPVGVKVLYDFVCSYKGE